MNEPASWQSFTFIAFLLTGTPVDTSLVQRTLAKRCPCSVFHDRVYGVFPQPSQHPLAGLMANPAFGLEELAEQALTH